MITLLLVCSHGWKSRKHSRIYIYSTPSNAHWCSYNGKKVPSCQRADDHTTVNLYRTEEQKHKPCKGSKQLEVMVYTRVSVLLDCYLDCMEQRLSEHHCSHLAQNAEDVDDSAVSSSRVSWGLSEQEQLSINTEDTFHQHRSCAPRCCQDQHLTLCQTCEVANASLQSQLY